MYKLTNYYDCIIIGTKQCLVPKNEHKDKLQDVLILNEMAKIIYDLVAKGNGNFDISEKIKNEFIISETDNIYQDISRCIDELIDAKVLHVE